MLTTRHRSIARDTDAVAAEGVSLLGQLRAGKKATKVVTWPNSELKVLLRPLSNTEAQECIAHAIRRFGELGIPHESQFYRVEFEDECCVQILARACRMPDAPEKPFARDAS